MSDQTVRVATWNIHGLRAGVPAVASAIREQEPDLVLIQESGSRRRLRELAAILGWNVVTDPRAFPRRRVQNAILVRPAAASIVRSRLIRFSPASLLQPRGALVADLDERRRSVSAHLGVDRSERERHVAQLLELAAEELVAIGADLNARPEAAEVRAISERLTDVWSAAGEGEGATFPSSAPTARIDYLFVSDAVRPIRAWLGGDAQSSDHLMVVADLRMPD